MGLKHREAAGGAIFSGWLRPRKNTKGHFSFSAIGDGHKVPGGENQHASLSGFFNLTNAIFHWEHPERPNFTKKPSSFLQE